MRILHLAKYYWPRSGGMERVIQGLAEGVAERGHEAEVLAVTAFGDPRPGQRRRAAVTRAWSFAPVGTQELAPGYMRAAWKRADIIHLHHPNSLADVTYAMRVSLAPLVVTQHSDYPSFKYWLPSKYVLWRAEAIVVPSAAHIALSRELRGFEDKVHVIPHGVAWAPAATASSHSRPVILTWGLLGPGKGLEWGIRAMALLDDLDPAPLYRVLGQTHPKVVIDQGEQYRHSLSMLVAELGLKGDVQIDGRYRESAELAAEVAAADLILLPYDSRDQATSGVLVEAVAAGKLVIATRFPHSIELLSRGGGVLVEHESPAEIAAAIRYALADPSRALEAKAVARESARANSWGRVAESYKALASDLAHVGFVGGRAA